MPGVLAWIVAVECHRPAAGGAANVLDLGSPISRHALDWAEWVMTQPGTQLLLNVSATPGSEEAGRVQRLKPRALNPEQVHLAGSNALYDALQLLEEAQADTLLLLWIGHGVMRGRERCLVHQDARSFDTLRSWGVDSLLTRLRGKHAPALQIGVIDSCAERLELNPGKEDVPEAEGSDECAQHYYFSAPANGRVSLNPFGPTLASTALQGLKSIAWPPQAKALHDTLQEPMATLASRPVPFEWTTVSGDLVSRRGRGGQDGDALIARHALDARMPEAVFKHLWQQLKPGQLDAAELAQALRSKRLRALANKLRVQWPDNAAALRRAWARVLRMEHWVAPLGDLGLAFAHWRDLAQQLCGDNGHLAPPSFTNLRELLLWTLDLGGDPGDGGARADAALLRLMVLAAKEAQRSVPGSEPAVQRLRSLWQQDDALVALLPRVELAAALAQRPPVLLIELEWKPNGKEPSIGKHWLLRDGQIEPRKKPLLKGFVGAQLNALINDVVKQLGRLPRVELLVPAELLSGRREWVSYCFDGTAPGPANPGQELDTLVPICWRWRDRMLGNNANWQPALWQLRAKDARQRAHDSNSLRCDFEDEPPVPSAAPAELLGLVCQPPGPAEPGARRQQFLQALVRGHPYMLWPAGDPGNVPALKAQVKNWLAAQKLLHLPESWRDARSVGLLPQMVLFIDEPDRNPYQQMSRLTPVAGAA